MTRNIKDFTLPAGCALAAIVLAGCAGNRAAPSYEGDLQRAGRAVSDAEQAGAFEYGSSELNLARDKLRAAERAAEDGEEEEAQRLATEAELDAELAMAISRNQQTQEAVQEVRDSIRTLQEELRRSSVQRQGGNF